MDYHTFERNALAAGVLLRTQLALKTGALVVADTTVPQPLAAAKVTQPILDALEAVGGAGTVTWRVERLDNGTKRIHASQPLATARIREGWDAYAAA
jgi:hypothetical protein